MVFLWRLLVLGNEFSNILNFDIRKLFQKHQNIYKLNYFLDFIPSKDLDFGLSSYSLALWILLQIDESIICILRADTLSRATISN